MVLKIAISSLNQKPEIFEWVVWNLPISNKDWKIFSRDTSNCRIGINIIENKISKYSDDIPLLWLGDKQLPTHCNFATSLVGDKTIREEYADELPFSYIYALARIASTRTSLSKGVRRHDGAKGVRRHDGSIFVVFQDKLRC